jgi:hypothetical protein
MAGVEGIGPGTGEVGGIRLRLVHPSAARTRNLTRRLVALMLVSGLTVAAQEQAPRKGAVRSPRFQDYPVTEAFTGAPAVYYSFASNVADTGIDAGQTSMVDAVEHGGEGWGHGLRRAPHDDHCWHQTRDSSFDWNSREPEGRLNGRSCAWGALSKGRRTFLHAKAFPENEGLGGHWWDSAAEAVARPFLSLTRLKCR